MTTPREDARHSNVNALPVPDDLRMQPAARPTTPREDAIAALDWWANVTRRKYNPNGIDLDSVLMAGGNLATVLRAALGAEAETPDPPVKPGGIRYITESQADAIAAYLANPETAEALARAWGEVMDGRRIGSGLNAARISADTTTADDWRAILAAMRETGR